MDILNSATQGFFNVPVDPLTALPLLANYFRKPEYSNAAIVSPDVGRASLAGKYAGMINMPLVIMHKRRSGFNEVRTTHVVGGIITVLSIAPLMADIIYRIYEGLSISEKLVLT